MHFYYDAQNRPSVVKYNGNHYAYVYNLQGDVMALLDNTGTKVVSYSYNAWGKLLNTTGSMAATLGVLNPFRYRGYIYDEETGFYYLRSRYYYPNRGRFINKDSYLGSKQFFSHNAFIYCKNSSVNHSDPNGLTEEDISLWDLLGVHPERVSSILSGSTIKAGMLTLLANPSEYSYKDRGFDVKKKEIDCVQAINIADGVYYAKMVDAVWDGFNDKCASWGVISDFNLLQPGDLVFSLKLPSNTTREEYIEQLAKKKWHQLAELPKPHIGEIVTADFLRGAGNQNAVFQSCSVSLSPFDWDALYYFDTGPNITALSNFRGDSNWYLYIRP